MVVAGIILYVLCWVCLSLAAGMILLIGTHVRDNEDKKATGDFVAFIILSTLAVLFATWASAVW